jgi:peptidoglycan/xylan/chitin deacetylase (PgdA/CDA1 family)
LKIKHSTWLKLRLSLLILLICLFIGFTIEYALANIRFILPAIDSHWLIFVLASMFALTIGFISYYEYHGVGSQEGITRRVHKGPYVSITFDDGPSPKYTPQILDILKQHDVKATFFVVGKHVKKYPDIVKRMVAEGHDVGNHTYNHRDLVPATKATILKELRKTDEIIKDTVSVNTTLFRPPRGVYNQAARKTLVEEGYEIILWSLSSCDWRPNSPAGILKRIKRFTKNGTIILFHDSGALVRKEGGQRGNTVKALPMVIEYLKEQDYKILPIRELIALDNQEPEIGLQET